MRLLRLRLRDFKGTDDRTIELARTGVTIVEGPNEAGKSSILEALDLLLEELDSTNKASVRDVQPVGRDVGPYVEAEIEAGAYRFTYAKQWLRGQTTTLTVTQPVLENRTGREAHERVRAILAETVDESLWKALRISQGQAPGRVHVAGSRSLADALDRAAGTVPVGAEETSLFDRAREEYLHYWTDTGRPKAWAEARARETTAAEAHLAEVEAGLRQIEADVAEVARLEAEIATLDAAQPELERRRTELAERLQRIADLEGRQATLDAEETAARTIAEQARGRDLERAGQVAAAAAAATDLDARVAAQAADAPTRASAEAGRTAAAAARAAARTSVVEADRRARGIRAAVGIARDARELAEKDQRLERIRAARAAREAAAIALRRCTVDDAKRTEIEAAHRELLQARARLDEAGPAVTITALAPLSGTLDGTPLALATGAAESRRVRDALTFEVPGVVRIGVETGTGSGDLRRRAEDAEARYQALCRDAGVADVDGAATAAAERAQVVEAGKAARQTLAELGGETEDGERRLAAEVAALRDRIAAAATEAPVEGAATEEAARAAEVAAEDARGAEQVAEAAERAAAEQVERVRAAAEATAQAVAVARARATETARVLADARTLAPDAELAARAAEAEAAARTAAARAAEGRALLAQEQPEVVRLQLDNAKTVANDATRRRSELAERRTLLRGTLSGRGEQGLAEQRDAAITRRDAAQRDADAERSRAEARRALYDTLREARDAARTAYREPLRARIEEIARTLHGNGVGIVLGEDLTVESRALDGRSIRHDLLSVGAREQLSIITRIACAMIVAEDGGVPLILDDTLGNADPERLAAMGALLAYAGRTCQVIILTCFPDRFRDIGGAHRIRLG